MSKKSIAAWIAIGLMIAGIVINQTSLILAGIGFAILALAMILNDSIIS